MINYFLGAALIAAPFFIKAAPKTTVNLSQEYFLLIVSFLGLFLFGVGMTHRNLKILAIALAALAFTAANPFNPFHYYQLSMSIAGAVFIAMVYGKRKEIKIDIIGKCLALVCMIESAWIIAQYFQFNPHEELLGYLGYKSRAISGATIFGSLGNINHSAALVACTLPFLMPSLWGLPIVALIISGSALPAICSCVGVLVLGSYLSKCYMPVYIAAVALLVSAIALFMGLIPHDSYFSDSHRVLAWKMALTDVGAQLWGKGFGYVSEVFSPKVLPGLRFFQLHSEWLELYVIGGVACVVVGIYLIIPIFKNKGNASVNACLISLLVNSLGNFTFHIAPLFMIFGTCYALQLDKE